MPRQVTIPSLISHLCTAPCLVLLLLMGLVLSAPLQALECANSGTAPTTAPDDTGDGNATACGNGAVAGGDAAAPRWAMNASSAGSWSTALGWGADPRLGAAAPRWAIPRPRLGTRQHRAGLFRELGWDLELRAGLCRVLGWDLQHRAGQLARPRLRTTAPRSDSALRLIRITPSCWAQLPE